MIPFEHAVFITSALEAVQFPRLLSPKGSSMPEIALVGRSNVGKSSLLNFLLRSPRLAKVSSTPGKTQMINFFAVDHQLSLADLPGYGYAKVPKHLRIAWSKHLEEYFQNRQPLRLILLLIDIRRTPNKEDLAMVHWSISMKKPVLTVLTKCDKLDPNQVRKHLTSSMKLLSTVEGLILLDPVTVSIHDPQSRECLVRSINSCLAHYDTLR